MLSLVLAEATPVPTPTMTVDPSTVTPGFAGFAIIALLVIAVILLLWDMQRRIRRARYREEVNRELDREAAAAAEHDAEAKAAVDATDTDNATMDAGDDSSYAEFVERIDDGATEPDAKN